MSLHPLSMWGAVVVCYLNQKYNFILFMLGFSVNMKSA